MTGVGSTGSVDPTDSQSVLTQRSKTMGNELTIRVTTGDEEEDNEQIDKILRVLQDAEEECELDFPFTVIRNQYPR